LLTIKNSTQLIQLKYDSSFISHAIIFKVESLNQEEMQVLASDEEPKLLEELDPYRDKI
jgi:hypothetical protein